MGRKKRPFYRIIATDQRSPRDGAYLERLGHYDPLKEPMDIKIDLERVDWWLSHGASPSNTVSKLIDRVRNADQ
jgi:small subunit ribosomal protein S16